MMKFWLITLLCFSFVPEGFAQLEDKVYKDHIQSVRIFPSGNDDASQLNSPVVSLNGSRPLLVLFDDLAFDPELYSAKLIHCDADWNKSQLRDNDFLSVFNEFNIQDYDYSINTRIPYIHYRFQVPKVTKSGNYILKVYRGRDEAEVAFTKRFMVYEELFTVGANVVPPSQTANRRGAQQINTIINYSKGEVMDPTNQIKVVLRQNQRWDNSKILQKPTFLNESSKTLRYELFDGKNEFDASNEFRFVDLRFIRATGLNIANIRVETDVIYADANINMPRPDQVYSQYLDLNGQYFIYTNDRPGGNPEVESEYMLVTFRFRTEENAGPVYMIGSLTQWGKAPEAKLVWDPKLKVHQTTLLLKQGWYDYQFALKGESGFVTESFEGSYFETENEYEVLVYFRNLGSRYDQLVSYINLNPNKRRL
jgi:hypothetical protein